MTSPQYFQVSLALPKIAKEVATSLKTAAKENLAFFLLVSVDHSVQYISNCERSDAVDLMTGQLAHWKAKGADIPGHINPDLRGETSLRQRILDLEAALRPFACLDQPHNSDHLDTSPMFGVNGVTITHGDLRRAASILSE